MTKLTHAAALSAAAAIVLAGASFAAAPAVRATIGQEQITQADVDQMLGSADPRVRMQYATPEGQQKLVEEMVDYKLFARSGRDQGLQNSEQYKKALASFEERLLNILAVNKVIEEAGKKTFSDADAQKYYNEHQETFRVPAAIRASHILIRSDSHMPKKDQDAAQKKAAELLREIEQGKVTFEEAAKNHSADGTRARGGDLGFFTKGQMVPAFEKAAFALKKGAMTGKPVKTEYGWHIIKVTDTRDASIRPFAEVKDDIKADLVRQNQENAVKAETEKLRAKYGAKIVPLPEPKSGDKAPAKPAK